MDYIEQILLIDVVPVMASNNVEAETFEISSTSYQYPSNSFQRKRRRLHANQRAQLIYQKIVAERKAEKEKRQLEREKRQKASESYSSIKRKMNKFMNLDKLEFVKEQTGVRFVIGGKTQLSKPNEFHYRCNYLYRAASLLCSQSPVNSGLETISKFYLREMKELCLGEMVRLEKDFGRTICKRCKNIFVARFDGTQSITIRQLLNLKLA
ncbi:hypothetical protein DINM_004292 [Dirofilaria immitis]|nr:hypothetical protein [Dirofilaria immitis]